MTDVLFTNMALLGTREGCLRAGHQVLVKGDAIAAVSETGRSARRVRA
jgi:hypothetical protein